MKNIDTHVCLISDQPVPNLTPLLDPALAPRRIVMVVTPDMRERAEWLVEVVRPRGIRSERLDVDDAWNVEHIQTRLLEWLERETDGEDESRIALNATGGTKLMSIAAYEVFRAYALPIFYVHPRKDRLIWLQPENQPERELADRVRLEDFLRAHGAEVTGKPRRNVPEADDLALAHSLVADVERLGHALGTLNWLAGQARPPYWQVNDIPDGAGLDELIDRFADHGKLVREGDRLIFPDETTRAFVNGGWIESYVFDQLRRIRRDDPHIHDLAHAVEVARHSKGKAVPNELDVACLRNNRLHIIECKTRRFREAGPDSAGAEALYKLDSLRDLMGGLQARAMLVSYRDLPDHDRTRAADLGISVCAGAQLRHLRQHLLELIRD